jgi:CheY-like chemotaxis protein
MVERKQSYLDAGFDDLVVKPYSVDEIERALQRWLVDVPRAAREADAATPSAPTSPSA